MDLIVLAFVVILALGIVFWKRTLPWWMARIPDGYSKGPVVYRRNKSAGVRLVSGVGEAAFRFPVTRDHHIHALIRGGLSLKGKTKIILNYSVLANPGVKFLPQEDITGKGIVSLMIQRKGDWRFSPKGKYRYYRLYAPEFKLLKPGKNQELVVHLDRPGWFSALGAEDPASSAHMADVINHLAGIHICFGQEYGSRAHGVFATGPSSFIVNSLRAV